MRCSSLFAEIFWRFFRSRLYTFLYLLMVASLVAYVLGAFSLACTRIWNLPSIYLSFIFHISLSLLVTKAMINFPGFTILKWLIINLWTLFPLFSFDFHSLNVDVTGPDWDIRQRVILIIWFDICPFPYIFFIINLLSSIDLFNMNYAIIHICNSWT